MVSLNKEQNIDASCINNKNESSSVIGDSEGNININNNNNNNESHGENDSASNSTPPSVTSAVGSRLSDYFEKMTEMQRRAFEKLYESASNGPCHSLPCHSSNSSEGPCHALVVCEQSLEQNFKEMNCQQLGSIFPFGNSGGTRRAHPNFNGSSFHPHQNTATPPSTCEYCHSKNGKCSESCERPTLFFMKKKPPLATDHSVAESYNYATLAGKQIV